MTKQEMQELLAASEKRLETRLEERLAVRLRKELNADLATYFGKQFRYFEARFEAGQAEMTTRLDRMQDLLASVLTIVSDIRDEQTAMKHQLNRHEQRLTRLEARPTD